MGSSRTGVLLIQLGTPDEPTPKALRRYLRQFLSDPRVIEAPSPALAVILNLTILPTRPRQSAAKYRRIWDQTTGSPLLHFTRCQQKRCNSCCPTCRCASACRSAIHRWRKCSGMIDGGVDRLIVLPMYPQYSATTTASAMMPFLKP